MSDLISRDALLKRIAHHTMFDCLKRTTFESANAYEQTKGAMFDLAQKAPAVDAVPVVHARWIHDINNLYGCSACLERETMSHKKMKRFCPNCGVKMDATDNNVGHKDGGAEE